MCVHYFLFIILKRLTGFLENCSYPYQSLTNNGERIERLTSNRKVCKGMSVYQGARQTIPFSISDLLEVQQWLRLFS